MRSFKVTHRGIGIKIVRAHKKTYFDTDGLATVCCAVQDEREVYKDIKLYIDSQIDKKINNKSYLKLNNELISVEQFDD